MRFEHLMQSRYLPKTDKVDTIIAKGITPQGLGLAVVNRPRKVANFIIEV